MRRVFLFCCALFFAPNPCYCWGFFGHRLINARAVFLLPPPLIVFFKKHIDFISEHAVDPDKRRYAVAAEGPRHFIDLDRYGVYPFAALPRIWDSAVQLYGADSLQKHGIVPWWIQRMQLRLTHAFREKNQASILKLAAEIGHYIGDAHVPLHTSSNHNGQYTNQVGIHGFWESRIPELFAEKQYDFIIGKAAYIPKPGKFIWERVLESATAVDSVLLFEKALDDSFPVFGKYAFEERQQVIIRQYSSAYAGAYQQMLNGMVERRMRQAIFAVASFWYTAWVDAGQPNLSSLSGQDFSEEDRKEWEELNRLWNSGASKESSCPN